MNTVKKAFIATLPIMAGYLVLGIGFGILLVERGYSFIWAVLMSLTIYAGSMQYVGVELIATHASLITTALMTLLINARHLFYGISMIEKYRDIKKTKPYLIFALTDETYSLVCDGQKDKRTYFWISFLNQIYWICGTLIGGLMGNLIHFNTEGIDFAMTALFIVIFIEQWENQKNHLPALLGLGLSIFCLIVFKAEHFLIPSMVLITISLFIFRKKLESDFHE